MDLSQIINRVITTILLFLVLAERVAECGQAYIERESTIPLSSILKRIDDISALQCIRRCRRSNECHRAAMRGKKHCLFLSSNTSGGMKCEKDTCDGVRVTIYEKHVEQVVQKGEFSISFTFMSRKSEHGTRNATYAAHIKGKI